jgi:peptidoglycan LD-endopeptidase LytH
MSRSAIVVRGLLLLGAISACNTGDARPAESVAIDTLVGLATRDTGTKTASSAELNDLRAELAIPLEGVKPADLRDSYAERRGGRAHEALDILAARGTPVLSAADGRLLKLFDSKAGGLMVYAADRSDRFILMYGHLDHYADGLSEGMSLRRGQVVGYVGTTGNAAANAPHLHFAIARGSPRVAWWKGTPVNPYPLLMP